MGFFSTGTSHQHYLGIWYTKYDKEESVGCQPEQPPIADSSGNLTIDGEGKLKPTFNGGSIRLPCKFVLREYGSLDGT